MSSLSIHNRHTGETLRMRRERDVSGQVILIIEGTLPAGSNGPPPHVHFQQREEGVVQAGTLGARIGEQALVVPTLEDVATLLRLLPRSATGQKITVYASLIHGPRRPDGTGRRHCQAGRPKE